MRDFIIFALLGIFAIGCNQEAVVENDLPFHERLVIQSTLREQSSIIVNVSKTQPLTTSMSGKQDIENAIVVITSPALYYPDTLLHTGGGNYVNCNTIAFTSVDYSLKVSWGNKHCSASTRIPKIPVVTDAKLHIPTLALGDSTAYVTCLIKPETGFFYYASIVLDDEFSSFYWEDSLIGRAKKYTEVNEKGLLEIKSREIPLQLYRDWRYMVHVVIYAYDDQLYNYFLTQNANLASNSIFTSVGTNTRWNVHGDGLGLFIGHSFTRPIKVSGEPVSTPER